MASLRRDYLRQDRRVGLRGEIGVAIPVSAFGLGLLGWVSLWPASFAGRTQKSTGQVSRVRTAYLEMELDHDSGTMRGRIVAGRHEGMKPRRARSANADRLARRDRR